MATIMRRAIDSGFKAEGMLGFYVLVSLTNRNPSIMEVAFALNVPQSACTRSCYGVTIDVRKV